MMADWQYWAGFLALYIGWLEKATDGCWLWVLWETAGNRMPFLDGAFTYTPLLNKLTVQFHLLAFATKNAIRVTRGLRK